MNRHPIANLTRSLLSRPSRREMVHSLIRLGLGLSLVALPEAGAARKRRKKRKKHKKQKVSFNAFGCVDVGRFCQTNEQCCSGICAGQKDKKTCQAHDESTCARQDSCTSETAMCTTSDGIAGACFVTTGNASHCSASGLCFACATDAECVPLCGAGAACIVCHDPACAAQGIETNCAGLFDGACFLS